MIRNFILFAVSIIVSLLIGELAVRLCAPQQLYNINPKIWRSDNTTGWRHAENADTVVNTGDGAVHFVTDENGYRINRVGQTRNEQFPEVTILIIGDSFIEALAVENEFTIPEVLKNNLSKKEGKGVEVVSSGVSGWDPNHYYLEVKRALLKRKYALVIVFLYVANDIVDEEVEKVLPRQPEERQRLKVPSKFNFKEFKMSVFYPVNDSLKTRSHLYGFLKNKFQAFLMKVGLTAYYFPRIFYLSEKESGRWDVTADICKKIKDELSKYDIPGFFVLLPAAYQIDEERFSQYVSGFNIPRKSVDLMQPNILLKTSFEQRGLALIDVLEFMRQKQKEGFKMYSRIDGHLNKEGHKAVADYLTPIIELYLSKKKLK